jgi:outer membrane autotransporter protein
MLGEIEVMGQFEKADWTSEVSTPNVISRGFPESLWGGLAAFLFVCFAGTAANAQCGPAGSVGISSATALLTTLNSVNTAFLTQTSSFVAGQGSSQPNQLGGGVWARGVGGSVTVDGPGTVTFASAPAAPTTCNSRFTETFGGGQVGVDVVRLNLNGTGTNVHLGVTGGYFDGSGHEVGGPATGAFQVPFIGVYAAMIRGGFFADILGRWDFYDARVSQFQVGLADQGFRGHASSVTGSVGYNFNFGTWFIEPSAGLIWARSSFDTIPVAGNPVFNVPAGSLLVGDIDSVLGRAGVRIGTSFVAGSVTFQPFVAASAWHEFASDASLSFVSGGAQVFNLVAGRVGTYGQYSLGSAFQISNSGWAGYIRGDYRRGDRLEGASGSVGLRYQFGAPPPPLITKG